MIAIVCIDDYNGMMFHQRRQSKDGILLADIMDQCKGHKLYLNEYSNKMFQQYGIMGQVVDSDFLQKTKEGEFCFVENVSIGQYIEKIEKIILYQWNRHYPADLFFDVSLIEGWKRIEEIDFQGNSHEKITREIYIR